MYLSTIPSCLLLANKQATTFDETLLLLLTKSPSYYSFAGNSDRCMRSYNAPNDLSNKVFVSNKTEDLNLSDFKMITGIN